MKEEDVEFEEELYTAGNVVVWSQGSRTQASSVYKAFTVDSPVHQVSDLKLLAKYILTTTFLIFVFMCRPCGVIFLFLGAKQKV